LIWLFPSRVPGQAVWRLIVTPCEKQTAEQEQARRQYAALEATPQGDLPYDHEVKRSRWIRSPVYAVAAQPFVLSNASVGEKSNSISFDDAPIIRHVWTALRQGRYEMAAFTIDAFKSKPRARWGKSPATIVSLIDENSRRRMPWSPRKNVAKTVDRPQPPADTGLSSTPNSPE